MAHIHGGTFEKLDTTGDIIPGTSFVNSILIASGVVGGATILAANGQNFYDATVGTNALQTINFARPQKLLDIELVLAGTNVEVTIFFA